MRINFTIGQFKIENVSIEIDIPDAIFSNETNPVFKEIKTVPNQQPANKTNVTDFKECVSPNTPKETNSTQP